MITLFFVILAALVAFAVLRKLFLPFCVLVGIIWAVSALHLNNSKPDSSSATTTTATPAPAFTPYSTDERKQNGAMLLVAATPASKLTDAEIRKQNDAALAQLNRNACTDSV